MAASRLTNGWSLNGDHRFAERPALWRYDYSGAVGGIYYSSFVSILDPVLPLKPGITVAQAMIQGTTGFDANNPMIDANAFYVPQLGAGHARRALHHSQRRQACDTFETSFGATSRNTFRGPFQERFDVSVVKETTINERVLAAVSGRLLNVLNHASFDVPTNSASQYSVSNGVPTVRSLSTSFGLIQHTLGGPRTMQLSLHLIF